jgi:transcriptional regulator with XRE-family HTH domain
MLERAGWPADTAAMLSAGQIRAARAWLGWTQAQLAEAADVDVQTIKFIEQGRSKDPRGSTLDKLERAFEAAGLEFIDPDKPLPPGGPGVRMRKGGE